MGNLTRDPELRVSPSGVSVVSFGLAVNRKYKETEEVLFIDVSAFNEQAERIAKWFAKGRPILVEGRLKADSWQDKDGNKKSKVFVVLESFQTIAQGRKVNGDGEEETQNQEPEAKLSHGIKSQDDDSDEDVPF